MSCDQAESSDIAEKEFARTVAEQKSAAEYEKAEKQIKPAELRKESFVAVLHNELFVGLPVGVQRLVSCFRD